MGNAGARSRRQDLEIIQNIHKLKVGAILRQRPLLRAQPDTENWSTRDWLRILLFRERLQTAVVSRKAELAPDISAVSSHARTGN